MEKMRILLLGNQNWGKLCVERLIQENENLVGIVTDEPPEKENWYSSMWEIGEKNNIPVFHSKMIRKEVETILSYNPELIISVGFRQILPVEIIAYPKQGCINLHGSLLPKFRGHAPINWAIIKGEKEVGITVHYIDENVDTGTIITQRSVPISDEDTATTVYEGTLPIYPQLLMEAVNLIKSGNVMPKKQHPEEGFYCCRRYPKDSQSKWEKQTAEETHNFVRALSFPYPQSFTYFGDQKIFITKTTLLEKKYFGKPGRVGYKFKNKVIIICKNRGIQIDKIKLGDKS